jgi:MFS transporter, DHA1 family, tetracycline resistance protein
VMGVSQSGSSLARVIGPALAGPLFDLFGRDMPYYVAAAVMAGVLAMALRLLRTPAAHEPAARTDWRPSS